MLDCTDCILDGTDACSRGAGRAVDDKVCEDFIWKNENNLCPYTSIECYNNMKCIGCEVEEEERRWLYEEDDGK